MMKKTAMFMCIFLFLAGCAKNEIIIYGSSPNDTSSGNENHNGNVLVSFSATLENRAVTRAMSPMAKNRISQVYAYETTDSRLKAPFTEGLYTTSSVGMLTGLQGYKMYLTDGNYNMYAFSCNSSTNPPAVTNGITTPLKNGVDYLWWENLEQDIATSQLHIPIVYQHAAVQVVIDVSAGDGLKLDSLVSATIQPPTPGGILSLQTGIIEPADTYDTTSFGMGINKFIAQAIVLPTIATTPMPLTLTVFANGEKVPRVYTAYIPVAGKLAGGFSYVFSVIVDENTISFSEVSIENWKEVDETGKPIYSNRN